MAIEQEQTIRLLSRILVHGGEVLAHLMHPHLVRTLQDALESLLRAAFTDAADRDALIAAAQQLRVCLEDVSIVSGAPLGSLLLAERHVLLLQLHLGAERAHTPRSGGTVRVAAGTPLPQPKTPARITGNAKETMEEVLTFVRTSGPIQARDIIAGCGPHVSPRTVKRRIRDLLAAGHIRREDRDGVLLYRATA
jgi:hypothetical protein